MMDFQIGSGFFCDFQFIVTSTGTIDYSPQFSSFLSGKGTTRLTITGYDVVLDARYLPGSGTIWSGNFVTTPSDFFVFKTCRMVPCSHYTIQQGSGVLCDFEFQVDPQGKFKYASNLDSATGGFLRGNGTSKLEFLGFPLLIDARNAGGVGVTLQPVTWGVPFSYAGVEFVNLLPAKGFALQISSGVVTQAGFDLDQSGSLILHPAPPLKLSLDKFHGLSGLTATS